VVDVRLACVAPAFGVELVEAVLAAKDGAASRARVARGARMVGFMFVS